MPLLLRKENHLVTPWKNGGGKTTEIAIAPAGATLDSFDWRISLATIAQSGAFSSFPDIDRTLSLVEGPGVALQIDGQPVELSAEHPTVVFAGEAAVHATVAGGTTDFNVMSRRSRYRHRFERLDFSGTTTVVRQSAALLLFLAAGERLDCLERDGTPLSLRRFDSVLIGAEDAAEWRLQTTEAATVFVVDLMEVQNA